MRHWTAMTTFHGVSLLVGIFLSAGLVSSLAADPPKPPESKGFRSIFDGKSFEGWEGNRGIFRIEDKALVGGSLKEKVARNEFLCTTREYGDFELRLSVRLAGDGANGGIQFRSQRVPNHHEVSGYQADLAQGYWGCLYDESRRNKVLAGPTPEEQKEIAKPNEWNQYVIRCEGRRVQLWLNGRQTVDYREPEEAIPQKGIIGLQIHGGPPSEAWYKDITIRELDGNP